MAWSEIKKAINSNLSVPLNTFIQNIHDSWATQRARLDAAISTRATNAGVWAETGWKNISAISASDAVMISNTAEYNITGDVTVKTTVLNFKTGALDGTFRLKFDTRVTGGNFGASAARIVLVVDGIEQEYIAKETAAVNSTYSERNVDVKIPSQSVCSIKIYPPHGSSSYMFYFKNFRVCASADNSIVTKL